MATHLARHTRLYPDPWLPPLLPQWPEGICEQESVPSRLCPQPTRAPASLRAKPKPSPWPTSPHTACARHLVCPTLTLLQHTGLLAVPPAPATALPQSLGTGCAPDGLLFPRCPHSYPPHLRFSARMSPPRGGLPDAPPTCRPTPPLPSSAFAHGIYQLLNPVSPSCSV